MDIRNTILIKKIYILSICLIAFSCKQDKCIKGYGSEITEIRNIENFNTLKVIGFVDIELKHDLVNDIEIISGSNLTSFITTELNDSVVIVDNINSCNWLRSFKKKSKVIIRSNNLKYIEQFSSANIYSNDTLKLNELIILQKGNGTINLILETQFLKTEIESSSDFTLKGKINNFHAETSTISKLDASDAMIDNLFFIHNSELTGKANVINSIEAYIHSVGDFEITGKPEIIKSFESSKGKLILN
jgi:hypothetical protein